MGGHSWECDTRALVGAEGTGHHKGVAGMGQHPRKRGDFAGMTAKNAVNKGSGLVLELLRHKLGRNQQLRQLKNCHFPPKSVLVSAGLL